MSAVTEQERKDLIDLIIKNLMEKNCILDPDSFTHMERPRNAQTNIAYRGLNHLKLLLISERDQLTDPRWMTFKQAVANKYKVKKGAKGVKLERYINSKMVDKLDEEGNPIRDEEGRIVQEEIPVNPPIIKEFVVFNGSQIEGLPPIERKSLTHDENIELAEQFIASSLCPIEEKVSQYAFYSPIRDRIVLPLRDTFKSTDQFLSTTIHEMGHSTAHPTRLNRKMNLHFGTPEYAAEELKAELASIFTRNNLGLNLKDSKILEQNIAYITNWVQLLNDQPIQFFKACSEAEKISTFLLKEFEKAKNKEVLAEKEDTYQCIVSKCEANPSINLADYSGLEVTPELLQILKDRDATISAMNTILKDDPQLSDVDGHTGGFYKIELEAYKNGQFAGNFNLELGNTDKTALEFALIGAYLQYDGYALESTQETPNRKVVIEFNETTEEYNYPSLAGQTLTPNLLEAIKQCDNRIQIANIQGFKSGYCKTYFDLYEDNQKVDSIRIDIGDGIELNTTLYRMLEEFLEPDKIVALENKQEHMQEAAIPSILDDQEEFMKNNPDVEYLAIQNQHQLFFMPKDNVEAYGITLRETPLTVKAADKEYPLHQFNSFADRMFFDHMPESHLVFDLQDKIKMEAVKHYTDYWMFKSNDPHTFQKPLNMFDLQKLYTQNQQLLEQQNSALYTTYHFTHYQNGEVVESVPITLGEPLSTILFNHLWSDFTEHGYQYMYEYKEVNVNYKELISKDKEFIENFLAKADKNKVVLPTQPMKKDELSR